MNQDETLVFYPYRMPLRWLLLPYVPMALLLVIWYLDSQEQPDKAVMDWLCRIFLWVEVIVYGYSLYKFSDKFGQDRPPQEMTRAMVRQNARKVYRSKTLLVLQFLTLVLAMTYLVGVVGYIEFFTCTICTIAALLLFLAVVSERMAPDWERQKQSDAETEAMKKRFAGGCAGIPAASTKPASTPSENASDKRTTTPTRMSRPSDKKDDNAPWEPYNREQDRYHNWACNHDDPRDCDHDDCF